MEQKEDREPADPYLEWPVFLGTQDKTRLPPGDQWERVLVAPLADDIFDDLEKDPNLRFDETEKSYALQVREVAGISVPFFLYRRQADPEHNRLFRVLGRGLPAIKAALKSNHESVERGQHQDDQLLAVIDDGLGFLNERFQRATPFGLETRIEGVYIQSMKPNPPSPGGLAFGRQLSRAEVQAYIQRPDERAVYKEINAEVFAHDTLRTTEQAESHGSHIMDLSGGADPADATDPMRDVPMVLVQLPPQIVDDTSGMNMVPYILQGMHWILFKALVLGKSHVVVNLSFGITAGPKDGSSLFATHISFLINLAALLGIRLDIVVPFGNDFQNRQIASVTVPPQDEARLDVRLQPDDRAPNYIEIRPEDSTALSDIALGLVAPNGAVIPAQTRAEGTSGDIVHRGRIVGRIYHVAAQYGRAPYLLIATAPTAHIRDDALALNGQGPLIEAGNWSIVLVDTTNSSARLRIEIQRGDTIPGYRQRGRQAYFSDANGYDYDIGEPAPTGNVVQGKSYTRLGADAYITQDGTNSAFTVVNGALGRFHTVGGAFLREADPGSAPLNQAPAVAAQYTSLNTRPGRGTPTGGARSEHNRAIPGLRASGVLSGSSARYSGSSAAAAVYSRSLITQSQPLADAAAPGRLPEKVHHGRVPRD